MSELLSRPTLSDLTELAAPSAIMMVGMPGSGKSYLARGLGDALRVPVLSSDGIRKELGDEADQSHDQQAWGILHERAGQSLHDGSSIVVDATHAEYDRRVESVQMYREMGARSVAAVYVDTRLAVSLSRNKLRRRFVPETVVRRMYDDLQSMPPSVADGFDLVVSIRNGR